MKSRSASACIIEGYRLYTGNFKTIFRSSWLAALLFAAAYSALTTVAVVNLPHLQMEALLYGNDVGPAEFPWVLAVIPLLAIVCILLGIGVCSCGLAQLYNYSTHGSFSAPEKWWKPNVGDYWRTLKGSVLCVVLAAVAFCVLESVVWFPLKASATTDGSGSITLKIALATMGALSALAALPLCLAFFRYVAPDAKGFWAQLQKSYAMGIRHFGFIFIVALASLLVVSITWFVMALPSVIMGVATFKAYLGELYGDPLGLPSYIIYIATVVFLLAGFILAFILLSTMFTGCFMHGSIETHEAERRQFKMSSAETPQEIA